MAAVCVRSTLSQKISVLPLILTMHLLAHPCAKNWVTIQAGNVTNETDRALEDRLASEVHTLSQHAAQVEAAHMDLAARNGASLPSLLSSYRERIGQAEASYDAQQHVVNSVKDDLAARPAGVIAAHDQLKIHAAAIQNTGNALLYSEKPV